LLEDAVRGQVGMKGLDARHDVWRERRDRFDHDPTAHLTAVQGEPAPHAVNLGPAVVEIRDPGPAVIEIDRDLALAV
jgi:hypothetical protein